MVMRFLEKICDQIRIIHIFCLKSEFICQIVIQIAIFKIYQSEQLIFLLII